MEELTKTQLILLALLVSFVTSIATGIVTITLLDQAPPGVTQTINRVVERTVEKVVPGQAASVITKETTVVIKEENLIIDAVEKNSRGVVRIGLDDGSGEFEKALGVGVVVSSDGYIITDSLNLTISNKYLIKTSSNKFLAADLVETKGGDLALLKVDQPELENPYKFTKPSFGNVSNFKLGQTVVAIGGLSGNTVSTGIVSKLNKKTIKVAPEVDEKEDGKEAELVEVEVLESILSSIPFSSDYSGGPLINVDGFLLGINITRKDGDFSIPINVVLDMIPEKLENAE